MNTKRRLSDDLSNDSEILSEKRFVKLYKEELESIEKQIHDLKKLDQKDFDVKPEVEDKARLYYRTFAREFYDVCEGRVSDEEFFDLWEREEELKAGLNSINSLEGEQKQLEKELVHANEDETMMNGKIKAVQEKRRNKKALFISFLCMAAAVCGVSAGYLYHFEMNAKDYLWQLSAGAVIILLLLVILFQSQRKAGDQLKLLEMMVTHKSYTDEDMLFRILIFKLFNKESTWELLLNNFEDITLKTFDVKAYSKTLESAISNGTKIYNDAYISCANKAFGYDRKHANHLALLNKMFNEDKMQSKIVKCKTMEQAFNIIKSYPLIGNFMAYQLVTDINYSEVVNWKEDEFTVAGPGSLRGIKKCFIDKGKMSNEDIIRYMYEHQDEEFKRLNLDFKKIGNRPLQLIDCQNIFCELDKYCRQALPDLKSNRTKIKKHYVPKKERIEYIYPKKWKI